MKRLIGLAVVVALLAVVGYAAESTDQVLQKPAGPGYHVIRQAIGLSLLILSA